MNSHQRRTVDRHFKRLALQPGMAIKWRNGHVWRVGTVSSNQRYAGHGVVTVDYFPDPKRHPDWEYWTQIPAIRIKRVQVTS